LEVQKKMSSFEEELDVIVHYPEYSGKGCNIYSIKKPFEQLTEFEIWLLKHKKSKDVNVKSQANEIEATLLEIGALGCNPSALRSENKAKALPFTSIIRKKAGMEPLVLPSLRLYCYLYGTHTLILFNGGMKTKETVQECPIVRPHFNFANKASAALDNLFRKNGIIEAALQLDYNKVPPKLVSTYADIEIV
jgi:hypothetical protein